MNFGRYGGACGSIYYGPIIEYILTSNQYLSWRHPKLQEMSSPIYSCIAFNEWNAKYSTDEINFPCSKVPIYACIAFNEWNAMS